MCPWPKPTFNFYNKLQERSLNISIALQVVAMRYAPKKKSKTNDKLF